MYRQLQKFFRLSEDTPINSSEVDPEVHGPRVRGYEELYETHARQDPGTDVIGVGDFERIGRLELRILELAGFAPNATVLDFGCGIGRLAQQIIPRLGEGNYVGVDISQTMLDRCQKRISSLATPNRSNVKLLRGDGGILNTLSNMKFDYVCAFSVFTHMDLEDTYLHFQCIQRILKPRGAFVCSHLLLPESEDARNIFNQSSAVPYQQRRNRVLSVVTSRDLIESIAAMSGMRIRSWIAADSCISSADGESLGALGQAVSILEPA